MSINYPLTPPSSPGYTQQSWSLTRGVGISESPFTGVQQAVEFDYAKWKAVLSLPPMHRSTASAWISFLTKLHGRRGTFLLGDSDAKQPQNSISGTVTVNSNASVGATNLSISGTTAFKQGDYIQIGSASSSKLYLIVADQDGGSTVQIEPKLKTAAPNGTAVTYSNPKGIFRMDSNSASWETNNISKYGISFSCSEAD